MRAHGTRTKYVHDHCRCLLCRIANARYASAIYTRTRRRPWRCRCVGGGRLWLVTNDAGAVELRTTDRTAAIERRDELNATARAGAVDEPHWASPAMARRHLCALVARGIGLRRIAVVAGVSRSRLTELLRGHACRPDRPRRRRCKASTVERILAVQTTAHAAGARVPAAETWSRIEALRTAGWSKARIARALGKQRAALQLGRRYVLERNAAAVRGLTGAAP
jgi:hypothetical protein